MLNDPKDMFRYAAKDTVSFMADWRLYRRGGHLRRCVLVAATLLDHGFSQEVPGAGV